LELHERALEIREKRLGSRDALVAYSLNGIAKVHRDRGDREEALRTFKRAADILQEQLPPDHYRLGNAFYFLGMEHSALDSLGESRDALDSALAIFEKVFDQENDNLRRCRVLLADVLARLGDHEAAEEMYDRLLSVSTQEHGRQSSEVAALLSLYGGFLRQTGRGTEADHIEAEAFSIQEHLEARR
jgi:tetratricopeptide (TPR) repeat protein